jgi:predicted metal-dependent hydrolase
VRTLEDSPLTALKVRRIPFQLEEPLPFNWQPANPAFAMTANLISFVAVAFETYIVAVTKQALEQITDPAVRSEAEAFLRQEGTHAKAHRDHVNNLVRQYPGLKATLDNANASYQRLQKTHSLAFNLAYVADIEATFTPLFTMIIEQRETLFGGADPRLANLFLWHFVEEIEHRSAAHLIYGAVVPSSWYRTRVVKQVFTHVGKISREVFADFEAHVPLPARAVSMAAPRAGTLKRLRRLRPKRPADGPSTDAFAPIPRRAKLRMIRGLVASQTPWFDPAQRFVTPWARDWLTAYDQGTDMRSYFGAGTFAD